MTGQGLPPGPGGAASYDELTERLRSLRAWAGVSYREVHRRVVRDRKSRGVAELPVYNTVYRCLRPGRTRLDAELVVDIAFALLGDAELAAPWRHACRVIEGLGTDALSVTVTDQLPVDLAGFTGRDAELAELSSAVADRHGGAVVAIEGMAGVGKTTLAVHLAHRVLATEPRPDLCLVVNLRGYDEVHAPADPSAVLEGFLRLLGLPGGRVSTMDLHRRVTALRERLADRRALLLLDNAASADQVRPLLPDNPGCVTLVTSRRLLDGIPATRLALDVFRPAESVVLLGRAAGTDRAGAEPLAVAGIAEAVGHLPLALSVVAGWLRANERWRLADHLERLRQRRADLRLDDTVWGAIASSYDTLSRDQQRLLRLSALHPGADFDTHAAAALTDVRPGDALSQLDGLVAANLLQRRAGDRFELHDLVRVFAAERARDEEPALAKRLALGRLLDDYRRRAEEAMGHFAPVTDRPARGTPDLPDLAAATAWLDRERANLVATAGYAAAHDRFDHVVELSRALHRYLYQGSHLRDAETLHLLAVRVLDGAERARARHDLGIIYSTLGRHREARELLADAVAAHEERGDQDAAHIVRSDLGITEFFLGRFARAKRLFGMGVEHARARGERPRLTRSLRNLALAHTMLGEYPQALAAYQQALAIVSDSGDRFEETAVLIHIGSVHEKLGEHATALAELRRGLELAGELGFRLAESDALFQLGLVHAGMARHDEALSCHEAALAIALEDGVREIELQVRNGMGAALLPTGRIDDAVAQHSTALSMADELSDRYGFACAHAGLGHCMRALGDLDAARTHWQTAVAVHTELGTPEAVAVAAYLRTSD